MNLRSTVLALLCTTVVGATALAQTRPAPAIPVLRPGDYIAAVVNQELVTAFEVNKRMLQARDEAQRNNQRLPAAEVVTQQALDSLIEERAVLSHARDSGVRIDDAEIDRAVGVIAAQNKLTMAQLRERLALDGIDMPRLRANLRDQLMIERVRESEVARRIRVSDTEVEDYIEQQSGKSAGEVRYNIAQILIKLPDNPSDNQAAERRKVAEAAFARVRGGEDFAKVARELSEDDTRALGGELGLRDADRIPDAFLDVVRPLKTGELGPSIIRTGAGFHVLRLLERSEGSAAQITQTRARHILLRPSEQLNEAAVRARLADFRRQIDTGSRRFEDMAREHSLDGSAAAGGDLGWASPGQFVPEFEQAMNALAVGGVSQPVASRFGFHLIQVVERRQAALDRKQQRDQARAALRERKFEESYNEWLREVRGRAYVELREAPSR
jgi:peptidyl-prolyl cis-trans isomerase SurA